MKLLVMVILVVISVQKTKANVLEQDTNKQELNDTIAANVIYLELLGAAPSYSINYDRLIYKKISIRIGLGLVSDIFSYSLTPTNGLIPIILNFNEGYGTSKIEIGLGICQSFGFKKNDSDNLGFLVFSLNYRYLKKNAIFFKLGVNLFLNFSYRFIIPIPGLGFGYSF